MDQSSLLSRLRVSQRTFFRDLDLLRSAGFEVRYLPEKKYYRISDPGTCLADVMSSHEVAALLLSLTDERPPPAGSRYAAYLGEAKRKATLVLRSSYQNATSRIEEHIDLFRQELVNAHVNTWHDPMAARERA